MKNENCKNEIRKEIQNYKNIVAHLTEHIDEGKFDNLDVSQSKTLKKEINRLQKLTNGGNLLKAVDIPIDDLLYKYSNPKEAQKNAFKYIDKNAVLYKSSNPKKKYMIYDPNKNKMIHFGSLNPPYEDFLKHKNLIRRNSYLKRTENMRGDWKNNKYSSNNLSRNCLW